MDTRRVNLKSLVERFDTHTKAAEACGITKASMSRLLAGKEALGNIRARKIERRLDLPEGWLDADRMDDRSQWVGTYQAALAGGAAPDDAEAAADLMMIAVKNRFEVTA